MNTDPHAHSRVVTAAIIAAGSRCGANVETLRLLIERGAYLGGELGDEAMAFACGGWLTERGAADPARVRLLLDAGCDAAAPTAYLSTYQSPIESAIAAGSAETVLALLDAGCQVPAKARSGCLIGGAGSADVAALLFDRGFVEPDRVTEDDVLNIASSVEVLIDERVRLLRVVLDRRGDLGLDLAQPMLRAAQRGDAAAVEVLLAAGADVHIPPSPLAWAVWGDGLGEADSERTIDLLVAAGCDVHVTDEQGYQPLHGALMPYSHGSGYRSSDGVNDPAVRALLRHGAPVEITFADGSGPLHWAVRYGTESTVRALLDGGADPNRRDSDGKTAHDLVSPKSTGIASLLARPVRRSRRGC